MLAIITIILIVLTSIYLLLNRVNNYWVNKNIPFSKSKFLVGSYGLFAYQKKTFGENAEIICKEFPNAPLIGTIYGTDPALLVQDPDLIKQIMTKDFYYFNGRELSDYVHKEIFTKNLFFSYGDEWKTARQNLTPLFSSAKMKNMFHLIKQNTKELEKLLDRESGKPVNLRTIIARYAMDGIVGCAFGIDANAMGEGDNDFRKIAEAVFEMSALKSAKFTARSFWPSIFYSLGLKMFSDDLFKFFQYILTDVFKKRNHQPSSRNDFVDLMMTFNNKKVITGDKMANVKNGEAEKVNLKIDEEFLTTQSFLFFLAGFDTSAGTLAFVLFELAKNKDIQEKAITDIDEYLVSKNYVLEYDCIQKLPYLDQCISEALRLYPVLQMLTREVTENYVLNGVALEKGMRIHIPVLALQRNPKYFPEPHIYKPERFAPENLANIVPYTFLPFGEGPRVCIGQRFAKMQMIPAIVTILNKYRVSLAEGTSPTITFDARTIGTQTTEPMIMKLIPRDGAESRIIK